MAIYIGMQKIAESETSATYRLEYTDGRTGEAEIIKDSGEVYYTKQIPNASNRVYFRIRHKLRQHWEKGEFPERTCYAA